MKKITLLMLLIVALLFQFCNSSKKLPAPLPPVVVKLTYEADIKPIIATKCAPCHIPPQGRKEPYVTYAAVTKDIDDMIRRIKLNPGERGFMPQRNAKLSDSTIQVFEKWKADGLLEK
jgi:cytochrome c553